MSRIQKLERESFYYTKNANELEISLDPLESLLLVFEDEKPTENPLINSKKVEKSKIVNGIWNV